MLTSQKWLAAASAVFGVIVGVAVTRKLRPMRIAPGQKNAVLAAVSAQVRQLVSHPNAIGVSLRAGRVELKGPIFRNEIERLMVGVRAIDGVEEIDDDLEAYDRIDSLPEELR